MKNLVVFISLCLFVSCTSRTEKEYMEIEPIPVLADLESRMPGSLLVSNQYVIWTDPFSVENQVHVVDLGMNKEIGALIGIGNGPKEFVVPNYFVSSNNELYAYDMSKNRMFIYSIDSIKEQKNPFISSLDIETKGFTRIVKIKKEEFVFFDPDKPQSFQTEKGHVFGKYPFKENSIQNNYSLLQGNIAYNPNRNLLIYSTMLFPYMAAYRKKGDTFELVWEYKKEVDYTVSLGKITLNEPKGGMMEMALTKDYIVTLERDTKDDLKGNTKAGRELKDLPQTLFLYDYESNVKKIVDLKMPILRIASDISTNTIYAIVVNPEFTLVKCEIE